MNVKFDPRTGIYEVPLEDVARFNQVMMEAQIPLKALPAPTPPANQVEPLSQAPTAELPPAKGTRPYNKKPVVLEFNIEDPERRAVCALYAEEVQRYLRQEGLGWRSMRTFLRHLEVPEDRMKGEGNLYHALDNVLNRLVDAGAITIRQAGGQKSGTKRLFAHPPYARKHPHAPEAKFGDLVLG